MVNSRNIDGIIKNIVTLYENGDVGINLEDSIMTEKREIIISHDFCKTITAIKSYFKEHDIDMFLNIRTDPYIMGLDNPLEETISRIKLYEQAGADGIFVPCIMNEADIKEVVNAVSLPVNVLTMPNFPGFEILQKCGVKRISMGPFVYNYMSEKFKSVLNSIKKDQSFNSLFKEND